jgi:hypothetical protein
MNRLSSSVDLTPVSNSETVGITTPEAVTISGTTTTDNNLMAPRFPVTFMRVAEPGTNTAADTPITVYGPSISVSLEAGEYRVLPTSPAGFLLKSITSGSADLRSQPLKVSVNDPPQISIALNAVPQLMRKIGGRVIGHAKRIGSGPTLGISGTTNARTPILLDGSFEFSGVPPGTYTITPVPMAPGVALVGLTVVDTDVLNVEILLPATRDVVGRVFIEGDAPMPTSIAVVIPSGVANPSIQPSSNPPPPGSIGWQYAPPMPGSIVAPISTIMTVGLAVQRDGFFRIALPEGQRRISLMPASIPAGYSVKALTYGSIDLLTDAIKVDLADSEELRVILNTNGFRPGDR